MKHQERTVSGYRIELLDWAQAAARATPVRERVFIIEQGVPVEIELDEQDVHCCHALATTDNGECIATGRLLPDGHIGRMAVDAGWRKRGLGGAVLEALVGAARARGMKRVMVNAQVHALDFYLAHGFEVHGEEFIEAGIPHRAMQRRIAD